MTAWTLAKGYALGQLLHAAIGIALVIVFLVGFFVVLVVRDAWDNWKRRREKTRRP